MKLKMKSSDASAMRTDILAQAQHWQGWEVIEWEMIQSLARRYGCLPREVELAALSTNIVPLRYARNSGTVGLEGQARLLESTVAVVGLGGLGGYVTEALARMGIGHLILVDHDRFEAHNLNRQMLSSEELLGHSKVKAAVARIRAINSSVEVTSHQAALDASNLTGFLASADVVVDALDSLSTRLVLQAGVAALGIPLIHGSIAGMLGQVMTVFPGDAGLGALYGTGEHLPEHGIEEELGTPAPTPMAVAAWEAQETIKVLLGIGQPLRHRLLVIDMQHATVDVIDFADQSPPDREG